MKNLLFTITLIICSSVFGQTTDLKYAVDSSDIILLALPTPPNEDGSADLSYILKVAEQIGLIITEYKVVVDKSTVPVGTAELVTQAILKNAKVDFDVVSNPEFLREGVAVEDFLKPDRVVVGTTSAKAKEYMDRLYAPFIRQGNPMVYMDEKSAEMTKYAANAFLATKITFMNEISNLCEKVGADVDMVRHGIGSDTRIGKRFLFPGVGYGGSCFPKDVKALAKTAQDNDYDFKVLKAVMEVNDKQRVIIVDKISNYYKGNLKGKHFALWGLAFKPNTDDIREAPAIYIIEELLKAGATISAYDPEGMPNIKKLFGDKIQLTENEYDALNGADALVIVTEWALFRAPDFEEVSKRLNTKTIFDGRNLFGLDQMEKLGFYYNCMGRSEINKI